MATNEQLNLLQKAGRLYVDGTFFVARKPFYQDFTVHAFLKSAGNVKQAPLVYCLKSGKEMADYKSVFKTLIDLISPVTLLVKEVVTDFESAIWRGLRRVCPDVKLLTASSTGYRPFTDG